MNGKITDFGLCAEYDEVFVHKADVLPKVTFAMKNYNQQDYLAQAIAAAFAQTVDYFEILIWDDCSTDESAQVIVAELQKWLSKRSLNVRFCRGLKNLGNLGAWLALLSLARTDFVVKSDGDDISYPQRVEKFYQAWLDSGMRASVVSSQVVKFVSPNRIVGPSGPVGASMALKRSAVFGFPDIVTEAMRASWDDMITIPRALRSGESLLIKEPLVLYRLGSGVTGGSCWRRRMRKAVENERGCFLQWREDIRTCARDESELEHETARCNWHIRHADHWLLVIDHWSLHAAYALWKESRFGFLQGAIILLAILRLDWVLSFGMNLSLWWSIRKGRHLPLDSFCKEFVRTCHD